MKNLKKSLSVVLAVLIALTCLSVVSFAADEKITVKLRVEGITQNLFYDDVTLSSGANAYDALVASGLKLDAAESTYGVYVSGIEGQYAATFKGWDGWLYSVNDVEPNVSMNYYNLKDGDSMLVYYGDPYGIGMQYPVADVSKINERKISFSSNDTEYDENWNAVTVSNPVVGYTLIWDGTKITSDENGVATIPEELLTNGSHSVQIEKYAENGCPLALRLAPDFTVNVTKSEEKVSAIQKIIQILKTFFEKVISFFKGLIK